MSGLVIVTVTFKAVFYQAEFCARSRIPLIFALLDVEFLSILKTSLTWLTLSFLLGVYHHSSLVPSNVVLSNGKYCSVLCSV